MLIEAAFQQESRLNCFVVVVERFASKATNKRATKMGQEADVEAIERPPYSPDSVSADTCCCCSVGVAADR
jgi:hypothetical protein